jgi:hypothetical protein
MIPYNVDREKLLNAILFFSKRVKYPVTTKIFKLLFVFDFFHFKQYGQTVTNLNYFARLTGPVPSDFLEEIKSGTLPEDFQKDLALAPFQPVSMNAEEFEFQAKRPAALGIFSQREKKILDELVHAFEDASPHMMSEAAFLKNRPWKKTLEDKGEGALIDYLLAIDNEARITREHAEEALKERRKKLLGAPGFPTDKKTTN